MPVQAVRTGVSLNYEVSEVAVTGGPGDAVVAGQCGDVAPVAEPAQSQYGLVEEVRALLSRRVRRSRRSAASSWADVLGEFAGCVEDGAMGNQGEPLVRT